MKIRKIINEEMNGALDLIWNVFLKFEAPDYTDEGIIEFKNTINDMKWLKERDFYGAFDDNNKLLGVIATKDITHIALFFVKGEYQKQGIGRSLYEKVKSLNKVGFFTVNSSLYVHEIYKHLGFVDIGKEQCINGLKFYPMKVFFNTLNSLK